VNPSCDVEIRILSQPRYLCVVRAAVGAAVERYGFGEDVVGHVMLAVDEAVSNVIRHGYDGADDQPIWVRLSPRDEDGRPGFTIVVEDRARQIDPAEIQGRDLGDVRPGGLGVHIIQRVMDRVSYHARTGGGMRLVMSKSADREPTPKSVRNP